jgi:hypothetical protein
MIRQRKLGRADVRRTARADNLAALMLRQCPRLPAALQKSLDFTSVRVSLQ